MRKLKASEIAEVRVAQALAQGNRCALCQLPLGRKAPDDPCLDHDHGTGAVRGTLHRSCNALLGRLENNYKRYGVRSIAAFCHGAASYLQRHATNITGLRHPTHKSEDEKRIARNTQARKTRAAAKGST